jgi:protein LSM14
MSGYPPMNPYANGNMYMQQPLPQQQQQQQQQQQPPQLAPQQPLQQQTPQQSRSQAIASNAQNYWQPAYPPTTSTASPSVVEPKADQLQKDTLDELKAELEESDALQPTINEAAIEQLAKKVSELNTAEDTVVASKPIEEQPRRRYDNNPNYRGRGGNRHYGDRTFNKNKNEFSIPTSEFDFEASNAKFDKSEIVKKDSEEVNDEQEEIEIPQPDEFYDKVSWLVSSDPDG